MQDILKVSLLTKEHKLTIVDASSFPGYIFKNLEKIYLSSNQVLELEISEGDNIAYLRKGKLSYHSTAMCCFDVNQSSITVLASNIDLVICNE